MNILFANYGDFTTNSLNHIAGFAQALAELDHDCVVAVPGAKETISSIPSPRFRPATFAELLEKPVLFSDGRAADIVHAWTPREGVRRFVLAHQRKVPSARIVVHLEDNEEHLVESYMGQPIDRLREALDEEFPKILPEGLPHPVRFRNLLRLADGVTVIVDTLRTLIPPGKPTLTLPPGVDFNLYQPQAPNPAIRALAGAKPGERIIVFTGSNTFANEAEIRELYLAVAELNRRGQRTRLVRTGFNSPAFLESLPNDWRDWTTDLGFIEKSRLPGLLGIADVLVQPGRPGPFNDLRLPSKLPEFLAMGRPVVLPASNIGLNLHPDNEAVVLSEATASTIADACERLFADPAMAKRLGAGGASFARKNFDLSINAAALVEFYEDRLAALPVTDWVTFATSAAEDATLVAGQLKARLSEMSDSGGAEIRDLVAEADDLIHQCRQLEAVVNGGNTPLQALRVQLERERDDWKRTWELTDGHAKHLAGVLTETKTHASNLELTLVKVRAELDRVEFQRQQAETRLRTAGQQIAELNDLLADNRAQLAASREKVRRMSESFSWKSTAWLRSLRRLLIDPSRRKAAQPPLPPPEPVTFGHVAPAVEPDTAVHHFTIDYPQAWSLGPKTLLVRGWCFSSRAGPGELKSIRARLGTRVHEGVYGLKRLDVLAALRDFPQAEYCGFKIEVPFVAGDTRLVLEVGDGDGRFTPFFDQALSVTDGGGIEELTDYQKWIEVFEQPSIGSLETLKSSANAFVRQPIISVIVPVYNTPEQWLRKAVNSIIQQTYSKWELCLADDASPSPHLRPLLQELAQGDSRIKVVHRPTNGHISAASNSALELATGEFIALLDHDDELTPHALHEIVNLINAHPETDLIYSDEDKIDEDGRRFEPYFKPDWMPDLFLGQNYVSHLTVYRTSVVRNVGGFRVGYEGSQDWDLALRVTDAIPPSRIRHIPKILYHWRAIPGSTALNLSEKNYPLEAARRALTDHFARKGETVELTTVPGDHWRVRRPLPAAVPFVSLVIPTRNGLKFLQRCVDSILERTAYSEFEIVVVDNGSDDPATLAYLASLADGSHPGLRSTHTTRVLRYDAPFNYSAINNFAVAQARGQVIGLLNNDLEIIDPEWLTEMVSQAIRPEIGCVGALLYYPNDTIQHAGVIVGLGGVAGHAFRDFPRGTEGRFNRARLAQNYSAVTAACLLIRKQIYEEVGGLDEKQLAVAFNDVDFCLKVRAAGYRNLWTPFAELYHHESATRGAEDTAEKHERFRGEVETMLARWPTEIRHDPAYNPNLTLELTDFTLAAPPRPWSP